MATSLNYSGEGKGGVQERAAPPPLFH
ncbi:hypothetical protein CCACVL1_24932 [Corchorus capsularis]|uniref:Uncharacterized protein n=1 Tax=Corchorus capsularis TaxID=210143 RepID=A0A1R3GMN5_COCAP|nr:hypothetical protein CCACVL1_24932 [Corchorus capsularis]